MPDTQRALQLYGDLLDGSYDGVDRIVLRAYFRFIQAPGGFRLWWRRWQGSDEGLNNTRLMRVAGRFARRVRAWAKSARVPVIHTKAGERNEAVAERFRARAVMQALLALSVLPTGFTSSELATRVRESLGGETYSTTRAAYDLRKLRCKGLVSKIARSRRYQADPTGLRAMAALRLLRQKVLRPLLAAAARANPAPKPRIASELDLRYRQIHQHMQELFTTLGLAA